MPTRKATITKQVPPPEPHRYEGPWYVIDPAWYQEHGVSLLDVIRSRRSPSGARAAATESRSKRRAPAKTAGSWEQEMLLLAGAAARDPGFVTSDTPLLEAVFRVLLAEKNRPVALQEIADLLRQRYAAGELPRDVNMTVLQRLLERQTSYGIRNTEVEAPT
ncbi:MAG: hypothetical protein EXR47_07980 [Dehalococcoidia bacterium]|nr:hypothetical protein [Dehalococcoidia bacterium]